MAWRLTSKSCFSLQRVLLQICKHCLHVEHFYARGVLLTGIIKLWSIATLIKLNFFIFISVCRSIFWLRKSKQQQINLVWPNKVSFKDSSKPSIRTIATILTSSSSKAMLELEWVGWGGGLIHETKYLCKNFY